MPDESLPRPLYALDASRYPEQRQAMEDLENEGVYVFCPGHVADHHRSPITYKGHYWYVTANDFPYVGEEHHYLIIPHQHVTSFDDLPDEAGAELWGILRMLKRETDPVATAVLNRSGDMHYNGGSVAHIHVHFLALKEKPEKTVRFIVSALGPDDQATGH